MESGCLGLSHSPYTSNLENRDTLGYVLEFNGFANRLDGIGHRDLGDGVFWKTAERDPTILPRPPEASRGNRVGDGAGQENRVPRAKPQSELHHR